jgi:hypothetical protein
MTREWICLDMAKNTECKDPEENHIQMPKGTN